MQSILQAVVYTKQNIASVYNFYLQMFGICKAEPGRYPTVSHGYNTKTKLNLCPPKVRLFKTMAVAFYNLLSNIVKELSIPLFKEKV